MKIAFPLLNEKELANDFAHAYHIGIYDEDDDQTELISISEIEKISSVSKFFELLTTLGLNSVVSPHYSYMSLRIFKENQIRPLKAVGTNLNHNIKLHNEKALNPFDVYESLINDACASDCGSCETICSNN